MTPPIYRGRAGGTVPPGSSDRCALGSTKGARLSKGTLRARGANLEVTAEQDKAIFLRHHPKMREKDLSNDFSVSKVLGQFGPLLVDAPAAHWMGSLYIDLAAQGGSVVAFLLYGLR